MLALLLGLPLSLALWVGIPAFVYGAVAAVIFLPASRPWILIPTAVIALLCAIRIRHINR